MTLRQIRVAVVVLFSMTVAAPGASGPPKGSLIVIGGGRLGPEIIARFIELAGGKDAPLVIIPTADTRDDFPPVWLNTNPFRRAGMTNITVLHTRDRNVGDSENFVAPLKKARAVFFTGGRQWRLVDSYLGTRTEKELDALLARGGVIAGTSAGATIQGSYLVRGAREGNQVMMAKGYERGFGFLRGVAIDQHIIARKRENDLEQVITAHPALLGSGIDESTAIVVRGSQFEVIGASKVAVTDHKHRPGPGEKPYYFLSAGDRFDLKSRKVIARPAARTSGS